MWVFPSPQGEVRALEPKFQTLEIVAYTLAEPVVAETVALHVVHQLSTQSCRLFAYAGGNGCRRIILCLAGRRRQVLDLWVLRKRRMDVMTGVFQQDDKATGDEPGMRQIQRQLKVRDGREHAGGSVFRVENLLVKLAFTPGYDDGNHGIAGDVDRRAGHIEQAVHPVNHADRGDR